MAVADPRIINHIRGRLCINPSSLATAFPHGGTALGAAASIVFRPGLRRAEVRAEEFGGEVVEVIVGRETCVLGAMIRGIDQDAIATVFEDTTTQTAGGFERIDYPGATRSGNLGSDRSVVLLFSPINTEEHPGLILFRAIPLLDEAAELNFSVKREFGYAAIFQGIRNANDKVYQIDRLEDMELT